MNTIIEKLKAIIRLQIKRENLNFAALGGGGQTWNIETLEWVLKRLSDLEKEEKPSEKLEKEIKRVWKTFFFEENGIIYDELDILARHFAKWGAEHLKK